MGSTKNSNGEGSVFFDNHRQRWVASIVSDDGKRHKRTATTKTAAKQLLRQLLEENRERGQIASPSTKLHELLELWKTKSLAASTRAPSTIDTKLWACGWLQRELGDVRLEQLSADRIERGLAAMADAGLGRESLVKVRSVLNQVCRFGERRDLLRRNMVPMVELPAGLAPSAEGRALTVEQAMRLLDAAESDRLRALWSVMLMLGLRPGEALGLRWDAIDLVEGRLSVQSALRIGGSGLEITDHLKTTKSRRRLTMPPPLLEAFLDHRTVQEAEQAAAAEAWSADWPDLVFTTIVGTPIHPSNLRRHFGEVTERAGLGRWTPNELRHTAVSILSAADVPLERIADVVGHDGTRMTQTVYRHVTTPSIDHAYDPMNRIFGTDRASKDLR